MAENMQVFLTKQRIQLMIHSLIYHPQVQIIKIPKHFTANRLTFTMWTWKWHKMKIFVIFQPVSMLHFFSTTKSCSFYCSFHLKKQKNDAVMKKFNYRNPCVLLFELYCMENTVSYGRQETYWKGFWSICDIWNITN